jgi:hypothetical protein
MEWSRKVAPSPIKVDEPSRKKSPEYLMGLDLENRQVSEK